MKKRKTNRAGQDQKQSARDERQMGSVATTELEQARGGFETPPPPGTKEQHNETFVRAARRVRTRGGAR